MAVKVVSSSLLSFLFLLFFFIVFILSYCTCFNVNLQGAGRVVGYHNSSVAKALADLFPDIGIDKSKFLYQQSKCNKRSLLFPLLFLLLLLLLLICFTLFSIVHLFNIKIQITGIHNSIVGSFSRAMLRSITSILWSRAIGIRNQEINCYLFGYLSPSSYISNPVFLVYLSFVVLHFVN